MLFGVIRVMDLHMAEAATFMLIKIFKVANQIQDTLMIHQAIILLIRLIIYLEKQHHNYRNVKCIRSYLSDIIKKKLIIFNFHSKFSKFVKSIIKIYNYQDHNSLM